jgi:hypothetical protein
MGSMNFKRVRIKRGVDQNMVLIKLMTRVRMPRTGPGKNLKGVI